MSHQTFKASKNCLPEIFSWVHEKIQRSCCPDTFRMKLEVAIEEAIVNILTYAYENEEGEIAIHYEVKKGKEIVIILQDQGLEFNPTLAYLPVKDLSLEERAIGGLGIPFIMGIMDKIEYTRIGNMNQLVLTKYL